MIGFTLTIALALYTLRVIMTPFVIETDGTRYLTRYRLIRTPWFRVFVHHIHRPDADRCLHNHPWTRACALVLRGGYQDVSTRAVPYRAAYMTAPPPERLVAGTIRYAWHWPGEINTLPADGYHRITRVEPDTWTLFVAGPRDREWGFLSDRHVPWWEYLGVPRTDLGD